MCQDCKQIYNKYKVIFKVFLHYTISKSKRVDLDINCTRVDLDINRTRVDLDINRTRDDLDINRTRVDLDINRTRVTNPEASINAVLTWYGHF